MNEFVTVQLLLSLAGCVGIVMAITQLIKKYTNVDPKKIALVISIIIGIIRIIIMQKYDIVSIIIGLLNIVPILWGAMGGYDSVFKAKCDKTVVEEVKEAENSNTDEKKEE